MKIRNQWLKYYAPESGGEGEGGAGAPEGGAPEGGAPEGGAPEGGDWMASLGEPQRSHLTKNGIKDITSLIDNHIDLQGHVGNSIRVPGPDASDDAKQDFISKLMKHAPDLMPRPKVGEDNSTVFAALGRPDDADGYGGIEVPENIADFVPEDRVAALRELAHKNNLTTDQFKGVLGEVLQMDATAQEARMSELKQGQDAVRQEWGAAFDSRSAKAIDTLESTGAPQAVLDAFKNGQATGDAIKWAYELSTRLGGGQSAGAHQDSGNAGVPTPAEAKMQLSEVMNNHAHPYWDSGHPDHKDAMDRVIKLGRLAEPETANQKIRGSMTFES